MQFNQKDRGLENRDIETRSLSDRLIMSDTKWEAENDGVQSGYYNRAQIKRNNGRANRDIIKVLSREAQRRPTGYVWIDINSLERRYNEKYAEVIKKNEEWKKDFGYPYRDEKALIAYPVGEVIDSYSSEFTELLKRQDSNVKDLEKKIMILNTTLTQLKHKDNWVLTPEERRKGEPLHPQYPKINAIENEIRTLNFELSLGREELARTKKQTIKAGGIISRWISKHGYDLLSPNFDGRFWSQDLEYLAGFKYQFRLGRWRPPTRPL